MASTTGAQGSHQAPLLDVDVDGALVRLRARYDPELVEEIKRLPGRRYVAQRTEWVVPARREALVALAGLLVERGDRATLSNRAARRLQRHGPGRLGLSEDEFAIHAAPHPRRLERIRALPERRWLAPERCWQLPATRAGALALTALIDDGELVATPAATARLAQLIAPRPPTPDRHDPADETHRASPMPHWRHVTRGPVFAANPQRREWIDGVGWCVRIRVDPSDRRADPRR
jgi:hypothetical protein